MAGGVKKKMTCRPAKRLGMKDVWIMSVPFPSRLLKKSFNGLTAHLGG